MNNARAKLQVLAVALVTLGPVIAAYLLYYGGDPASLPRVANAERDLLETPVKLPALAGRSAEGAVEDVLSGPRWSLIYARTGECDDDCLDDLLRLRQVQLALGRDLQRVARVYIGSGDAPRVELDRAMLLADFTSEDGQTLLETLRGIGRAPGKDGRVFVADPDGNLVISYPPDPDQDGLLDDLKRLLRYSQTG